MQSVKIPMTRVAGMGKLPEILEAAAGRRTLVRVFRREHLPLDLGLDPDRPLPLAALIRLFDSAGAASGDRCFGLRVGEQMSHRSFGRWVDYSLGARTLGHALSRVSTSVGLFQSGAAFDLHEDGKAVYWSYRRPHRRDRGSHHADHVLPPMISFLREYLGEQWMPDHVCLCYPRDAEAHLLERRLGTAIRFGSSNIAVALSATDLLEPRRTRIPVSEQVTLKELLADEADRHDSSACSAVRHILRVRLTTGVMDIEGTASLAGLGIRSLQRRIRAEGTTYQRIVDEVRMQRAAGLLEDTDCPIAEIAAGLGYNEPGNFTRAFRRTTGVSPMAYRNRHHSNGA